MPNWNQILNNIQIAGSTYDIFRRNMLARLHQVTGRNIIIYYSGWLQKQGAPNVSLNDDDKNGFMTVINKLDRSLGLDLLLHTPGGETAATESLVDYLRSMFGTDIRAIIPQLAMSAGTMIACACKELVMGKQSSLGPIDPQFRGIPAHGVMEEFERAAREIKNDPSRIAVWQPIIAKYSPAFIGECEKAIDWSNKMTAEWLRNGMFKDEKRPSRKINRIITELSDLALTKSHARHLSMNKCQSIGLKVVRLEDNDDLQDAVLSVHHSCMLTLKATQEVKTIKNNVGVELIKQVMIAKAK